MRMLLPFTLLAFLSACGDGNPTQPTDPISITLEQAMVGGQTTGAMKMLPFKARGTWEGAPQDATAAEIEACTAAGGTVDVGAGVINVTHLGRSSYRVMNCWGPDEILYEEGLIVAANGDELYFHGPGEGGWQTYEVDWSVYPFTYAYSPLWFIGGTGRFEGATGSFLASGDAYYEATVGWYGTEFWKGTISSVGSGK